jgi:TetR/AcrR family transcriptional repressor of nem operon
MMAKRGEATRQKILDAAQAIILEHGYSAASVDRVLDKTGLTKGAFFYHYKTKNELIRALIDRYAASEERILDGSLARADTLSRDPLQRLLIALGFLIEMAETAGQAHPGDPNPGCLFGSFAYEMESVVPEIRDILRTTARHWRTALRQRLDQIASRYPPRLDVDLDAVADNLLVAYEGGLIVGRMLDDPRQIAQHLRNYRNYLELLFTP